MPGPTNQIYLRATGGALTRLCAGSAPQLRGVDDWYRIPDQDRADQHRSQTRDDPSLRHARAITARGLDRPSANRQRDGRHCARPVPHARRTEH
ncbi:hypothetical protein V500_09391 [Pseudogymnoascus sp. VKM F-4518 (FW-2643)]|nr:hypothetical protein V500_09391 [Pseudogymnoascus sp. VKM F-4518 (FW-2643)]